MNTCCHKQHKVISLRRYKFTLFIVFSSIPLKCFYIITNRLYNLNTLGSGHCRACYNTRNISARRINSRTCKHVSKNQILIKFSAFRKNASNCLNEIHCIAFTNESTLEYIISSRYMILQKSFECIIRRSNRSIINFERVIINKFIIRLFIKSRQIIYFISFHCFYIIVLNDTTKRQITFIIL